MVRRVAEFKFVIIIKPALFLTGVDLFFGTNLGLTRERLIVRVRGPHHRVSGRILLWIRHFCGNFKIVENYPKSPRYNKSVFSAILSNLFYLFETRIERIRRQYCARTIIKVTVLHFPNNCCIIWDWLVIRVYLHYRCASRLILLKDGAIFAILVTSKTA